MIELKNVSIGFGQRQILRDISLTIPENETLVILGASGSGKSTILRLIIGLLRPTTGTVCVDGEDITFYNEDQLNNIRQKMGMVFQYSALFDSMTVAENVAFGLRRQGNFSESQITEEVQKKLKLVGLDGWQETMPANLSGGMKKRVSLARAIAVNPKIILYDEPTAGLDPIRSTTINHLINTTQKKLNATSIVVTHDLKSADYVADRVAFLHEGQFVEIAGVEEFKNSKNPLVVQFLNGIEDIQELEEENT